FTLRTGNDASDATLNTSLYTVSGAPEPAAITAPVDLRFEYRDSAGIQAVKEFHLDPASFVVGFRAAVSSGDKPVPVSILWGPAVGDVAEVSRYTKKAEGLLFQDGKVVRLQTKDIAKQSAYDGDFKYAGVDDNYFLTAALYPGPNKVSFQPVAIPAAAADSKE